MTSVLIVEDDPTLLRGLKDNFAMKGYRVRTAQDGEQALKIALEDRPELIILDIMLPEINGYEVCSCIREKNLDMPIIMLTAKDRESDIVLGLNVGADDYVTKPFSIKELLARADAFMRRRKEPEPTVYEFGDCRFDIEKRTLTRDGKEVKLTPGEFKMLQLFLRRSGCALTCDEILSTVWGYAHFVSVKDVAHRVDVLRKKIESDPRNPALILTIKDIGYKFQIPAPDGNNPDS